MTVHNEIIEQFITVLLKGSMALVVAVGFMALIIALANAFANSSHFPGKPGNCEHTEKG